MLKAQAIAHFGTQAKLADQVGRAESTVSEWPDVLPLHAALVVEKLTGGKLLIDWSMYPDAPKGLRPQ